MLKMLLLKMLMLKRKIINENRVFLTEMTQNKQKA